MNSFKSLIILMLAFGLTLAVAEASASVNVDIKLEGKADYKGKGSATKTQSKNLNIRIANYGNDALPDVTVKWWIFGHKMTDHKLFTLKKDVTNINVPAKQTINVTTPEIKVTGTREHKVSSSRGGSRGGHRGRSTTKTVPASGEEFSGYAVEVYSGKELLKSFYSNPSIKDELQPKQN